jgi:hypothetical protein
VGIITLDSRDLHEGEIIIKNLPEKHSEVLFQPDRQHSSALSKGQ